MEDNMLRPTVMMLVVLIFAVIAKGVIDYLGRRQLIARGVDPDDLNGGSTKAREQHLLSNLKWALVLLGFGSAVILYDSFSDVLSMTGGFGLMFVGAGLGYLVYFLVAWRWSRSETHTEP
ncbi:MAG: hypothetical protein JSU74_03925 [Candidatus Zixiibacteriota bacterium]|nr:MAG: hypothetical protein JSU74_03925 [candidate division Zixibacteria bacterium]